jgi:hypothetical protein
MDAFLQMVPPWVGGVGWLAVLVGFFLQRKALVEARNLTTIKGNRNQVSNTIHQSAVEASGGDSVLVQCANWATIAGLVLTLLPLLKDWLGKVA